MVLSFDPSSGNSVRPRFCRCGKCHFRIHSHYRRIVAQVLITRFICVACRLTISMIPNHCVPYKHYPVSVINPTLDSMMLEDQSSEHEQPSVSTDVHPITALRWRQEFRQFSLVLATEGAKRLGISSITGTDKTIYHTIKAHFSKFQNNFFTAFQVVLCGQSPPIGVFRSFSF